MDTSSTPDAPRKSWPRRHKILTALGVLAALIVFAGIAGALGSSKPAHQASPAASTSTSTSGSGSTTAPAAPAAAPAPAPSPDGTYTGSCDYDLSSSIGGNDHLTGEVDLTNTGNVGTIVRVRITWPQEGYPPIVATRTVRTAAGQHKAVRFHVATPDTGNVIDRLQSWQERHNFKDGCHYRATITGNYGQPQG